jgi:heat-inducible transcriptional repressor
MDPKRQERQPTQPPAGRSLARPVTNLRALPARLRRVLVAILEAYVESAQPVASKLVVRRAKLGLSSATVRAQMAELTELGLLAQPHTSAGRVPTDRAFRLYVDGLLAELPRAALRPASAGVDRALADTAGDAEELLRRATRLLSDATGQLGFVLAAPPESLRLRHVSFVRLSSERVLALLVSEHGVVQTRVFQESESDRRMLERISARLTEFVAGLTLAEARTRLAEAIEEARARRDALWRRVVVLGHAGLAAATEAEFYVGDTGVLLVQPEFSDLERLREVLAVLTEKERMMGLLDKLLRARALQVAIGTELDVPEIRECAVITAPLGASAPLGGLGVIGPVRMRYDRVIPLVRELSGLVSHYLA